VPPKPIFKYLFIALMMCLTVYIRQYIHIYTYESIYEEVDNPPYKLSPRAPHWRVVVIRSIHPVMRDFHMPNHCFSFSFPLESPIVFLFLFPQNLPPFVSCDLRAMNKPSIPHSLQPVRFRFVCRMVELVLIYYRWIGIRTHIL
jgi:hypothetical protein